MKHSLRPSLAALLLASLGGLVVAVPPASAQYAQRSVAPAPADIERFVLRAPDGGRIEPGSELQFRLIGTPGAEAWVEVPGLANRISLTEVRPGVYEGDYVVRRRDDRDAFSRAAATLRSGRQQAVAQVDMRGEGRERDRNRDQGRDRDRDQGRDRDRDRDRSQARDDRPPKITHLSPADNERVEVGARRGVTAKLSDEGSGIDPGSVRLRLSGRDVTGQSQVSAGEVDYRADLRPGRYTAEVTARDRAGNSVAKSWNFEVMERPGAAAPRVALPGPIFVGPLGLQITSHVNNGVVNAAENVRLEGQTAPHAKVRVEVDTLVPTGSSALAPQKLLDQEVEADAGGRFFIDISPSGYVVPGVRYDVRLTSTYGNRAVEQRLALHRRPG